MRYIHSRDKHLFALSKTPGSGDRLHFHCRIVGRLEQVHVVLRPRTDFVSAADTIWGIVDCCTGDLLKPRAYDVRYSDGGTERAPEAWVSAGRVTERGLVAQLRAQAHDDEEQEATPLLS